MLLSASKFFTVLALIASVAAAPQAASVSTSSVVDSASAADSTTDVQSAADSTTDVQSTVPTNTQSASTVTAQTGGVVTVVTIGSVYHTWLSSAERNITTSYRQTITLLPANVSPGTVLPTSPTAKSTTSAPAPTTTAARNGAPGQNACGMGLAAIVGVAGVVAAVL